MLQIRQYLLSMITVALVCAIIRTLLPKKGASSAIINLMSSVFLVITLISPWTNLKFSDITTHIKDYSDVADAIVNSGVYAAQAESSAIIKQETETYIVNKAKSFGVDLQAEITLCEDVPQKPKAVRITASTSPYLKQRISQFISADLEIPEADQVWN